MTRLRRSWKPSGPDLVMRVIALPLAVLSLAACDTQEARVPLPLSAPDGAHQMVTDFVDICSLYLVDRKASAALARARGWSDEMTSSDMAAQLTGVSMFEKEDPDAMLQFIPAVYPHLESRMCMVMLPFADEVDGDMDLSAIHQIDGLQGGFMPMPGGDAHGVGRWSFVAENGQTVLVNAMRPTSTFVQLNMSTHKDLKPTDSDKTPKE